MSPSIKIWQTLISAAIERLVPLVEPFHPLDVLFCDHLRRHCSYMQRDDERGENWPFLVSKECLFEAVVIVTCFLVASRSNALNMLRKISTNADETFWFIVLEHWYWFDKLRLSWQIHAKRQQYDNFSRNTDGKNWQTSSNVHSRNQRATQVAYHNTLTYSMTNLRSFVSIFNVY